MFQWMFKLSLTISFEHQFEYETIGIYSVALLPHFAVFSSWKTLKKIILQRCKFFQPFFNRRKPKAIFAKIHSDQRMVSQNHIYVKFDSTIRNWTVKFKCNVSLSLRFISMRVFLVCVYVNGSSVYDFLSVRHDALLDNMKNSPNQLYLWVSRRRSRCRFFVRTLPSFLLLYGFRSHI